MLSISAPMSGAGSANYYLELAQEDYYLEGGEPPGTWHGLGARALGLNGKVERGPLHALLDGFNPDRTRKLVQNAGNEHRQSGWDLTFSAPKGVSVAWSQAPPEIQQKIQAIQQRAVVSALAYLGQVAGFTRRGRGGAELEKAGLIAATFEHGTSRAQDPQLHTHALVLNICTRTDGSSGTIRSIDLFRHKMAAGALYRADLAAGLRRELGLESERLVKSFALKGVSQKLCDHFSTRRHEIEQFLSERQATGAIASKVAALQTRAVKQHVARAELFKTWQAAGEELGWGQNDLRALLERPHPESSHGPSPKTLAREAIKALTQHETIFTERQVLRIVADLAPEFGINARAITDAVTGVFRSGQVVHIASKQGERLYTTPETLAQEKELLRGVQRSVGQIAHIVDPASVEKALKSHASPLSLEQREAVAHITSTPGGIKAVSGMAGTGKSTMLNAARTIWEDAGFSVLGAALSGKAAQGLQSSAGIKSATIAKTLFDLARPSVTVGIRWNKLFWKAPKWSLFARIKAPRIAIQTHKNRIRFDRKTILVVDEAGMVSTGQMKQLLDATQRAGAKLVLVGDPRQLQPIEAGAPFRAIMEKLGAALLKEIKRQAAPWAREVVALFAEGKAKEALDQCKAHGLVTVSDSKEAAKDALITDWKKQGGISNPQENLILANTKEDTRHLNLKAQRSRRLAGKLSSKKVVIADQEFYVNDRVLFTKNARPYFVTNGSIGVITELSKKSLTAKLDTGATVRVPLEHYDHIQLGYAVTTHKAQGMTAGNTFILTGGAMQDRELSYVQASRARGDSRFYTSQSPSEPLLASISQSMSKSHQKELATCIENQSQEEQRRMQLDHGRER